MGEPTEILQSVPVVVVLDDILCSLVAVLIATNDVETLVDVQLELVKG